MDQVEIGRFLQNLVRLDTSNPPGNELPAAELVAKKMRELGLEVSLHQLSENRANVVGVLPGTGARPALVFNGHLDTVPPGEKSWRYGPHSGRVVDGRIYGRGAVDMKGGLAAMVAAAGALARSESQLHGDLIVAGTGDEEVDQLGARALVDSGQLEGVGAIVIGEPTNLELVIAHRGALWLEITTQGKAAHGAMPQEGVNAIMHMNALLCGLASYQFKRYREHPLLGPPTISVGTIQGGTKTNVVPERCQITVDLRTLPGQEHDRLLAEFGHMIDELSQQRAGFKAKVRAIGDKPAIETSRDAVIVSAAIQAGELALGHRSVAKGIDYYTDGSVFVSAIGIPTIVFGPGDPKLAHQCDENVELEQVCAASRFYAELAKQMLA